MEIGGNYMANYFVLVLAGIMWFICGVIQWGLLHAYFSREHAELCDTRTHHIVRGLFGLIALIAVLAFLSEKNGFKKLFMYGFKL